MTSKDTHGQDAGNKSAPKSGAEYTESKITSDKDDQYSNFTRFPSPKKDNFTNSYSDQGHGHYGQQYQGYYQNNNRNNGIQNDYSHKNTYNHQYSKKDGRMNRNQMPKKYPRNYDQNDFNDQRFGHNDYYQNKNNYNDRYYHEVCIFFSFYIPSLSLP